MRRVYLKDEEEKTPLYAGDVKDTNYVGIQWADGFRSQVVRVGENRYVSVTIGGNNLQNSLAIFKNYEQLMRDSQVNNLYVFDSRADLLGFLLYNVDVNY